MKYRKFLNVFMLLCLGAAVLLLVGSSSSASAKPKDPTSKVGCRGNNGKGKGQGKCPKEEYEERISAAARAFQQGMLNPLMTIGAAESGQQGDKGPRLFEAQSLEATDAAAAAAAVIDGVPHYFSHPNYANSQLPNIVPGVVNDYGNPLVARAHASDGSSKVFGVLPVALPDGLLQSFNTWNQPADSWGVSSAGRYFHAYVLRPTGNANEYSVVFDSGRLTIPPLTNPSGEVASFPVANLAIQAGDLIAWYGRGIPWENGSTGDMIYYPVNAGPLQGSTITLGAGAFPTLNQARSYSYSATVFDLSGASLSGGMRKFVDPLPQVGPDIPVAVADTSSYPGSNYYEIALVQFRQQMHSDLPNATLLRGYVQLTDCGNAGAVPLSNEMLDGSSVPTGFCGVTAPSYLGPAIVTEKDTPVRILFRNLLPTGAGGNLFIPVDSTVMGSGPTPEGHMAAMEEPLVAPWDDPQNPACSGPGKDALVAAGLCFADNRAIIHLHGGITPWISDGTPHQWITPADETTPYPQGVSVRPVPDMDAVDTGTPDDGMMTFYYTNQQSARLMFYHDHAWGITRLNVYAGMAAPYIITDATEQALVDGGVIPPAADTIPLVVQDKTFVPDQAQLSWQDETWDTTRWGGEANLWVPHVYSPAQNPGDASGVNEFGRWAYGPWFWPPTNSVENGPLENTYYDPTCDPDLGWCEPLYMPGTPFNSMGMESFNDTPIVNGMAYPTLTLDPKAYRFRILNAANDRFFNLSLYQAIDANGDPCDPTNPSPVPESTGIACTEVALNPAEVEAALDDPAGVFPTPVVGTEGPNWIDIATEGGFLPAPVVVPAHPTTWVTDPTLFNAGNVDQHSLLIAPAERHDVIVDFSQFAGHTLILYNDAPAAFPARDPRYDYYTGNADLTATGGTPSTLAGYGPNTRTVMQIKVADTAPAPAFNLGALQAAFAHQADNSGVFESGQKPIVVGQREYNSAYGTNFPVNAGLAQIFDTSLTFPTLLGDQLTINLKPKMIQDEMGEAFGMEYGRMSGFLGVETQNAQAGQQNMILHGYTYPPDEVIDGIELPPGVEVEPIASSDEGTQIWKFTHNGVDTHPIHFHLYDVQLINRVGWDGIIRKPDPTELGWKDTVRVSPLEDTIVAIRPIIPGLPEAWGGLPNSVRLLDPSMPEGMYLDGANTTERQALGNPIMAFNPDGEPVDIPNHFVNFGWEYVYHCHILSHEEMDMMHAQVIGIAPPAPSDLSFVATGSGAARQYELSWMDNSKNESGFVIERSTSPTGPFEYLTTVMWPLSTVSPDFANAPGTGLRSYIDVVGDPNDYYYQVYAINLVGDAWDYSDPALNNIPPGGGWPTLTLDSMGTQGPVNTLGAPTDLTALATVRNKRQANVTLDWTSNSTNEAGFLLQRAYDAGFTSGVYDITVRAGIETYTDRVGRGTTYFYRVLAFSDTSQSDWSNVATVTTP